MAKRNTITGNIVDATHAILTALAGGDDVETKPTGVEGEVEITTTEQTNDTDSVDSVLNEADTLLKVSDELTDDLKQLTQVGTNKSTAKKPTQAEAAAQA